MNYLLITVCTHCLVIKPSRHDYIISDRQVLPMAAQRELFRLGAWPR